MQYDVLIVGGGAAGFFTAINLARQRPDIKIAILERGAECLAKVSVSGGGRCNVTHAAFLPKELSQNYPRGRRELLGPFHTFMTGDTMAWFEERGIPLKIEEDGRIFPQSDSSQTIIDCFLADAKRYGVEIKIRESVQHIAEKDDLWQVLTSKSKYTTKRLIITTGSNPKIWQLLEDLGHHIIPPVPSLFTFNCKDPIILDLPGISTQARLELFNSRTGVNIKSTKGEPMEAITGPVLITHWGFSGPAVLQLSAIAARELHVLEYNFGLRINWLIDETFEDVVNTVKHLRQTHGKQRILKSNPYNLPKRLWQNLVNAFALSENQTWAEITKEQMQNFAETLTKCDFEITGKSTFKEEFVTAGGVDLAEIDFKTFGSKRCQNLYFAGEVLNIDAVTGGFNFQNAWTGGFVVAGAIGASL